MEGNSFMASWKEQPLGLVHSNSHIQYSRYITDNIYLCLQQEILQDYGYIGIALPKVVVKRSWEIAIENARIAEAI